MVREKTGCIICNTCDPCGYGVDIPKNLKIYDDFFFGDEDSKRKAWLEYQKLKEENEHGGNCAKCHICEKICPQGIKMIAMFEELDAQMQESKDGSRKEV